jgi:hypothetical protein
MMVASREACHGNPVAFCSIFSDDTALAAVVVSRLAFAPPPRCFPSGVT